MIKKNLNLFYYFEFLNLFFKIIRKYYYSHTIFPVYYTDRCTSCKKYNNIYVYYSTHYLYIFKTILTFKF